MLWRLIWTVSLRRFRRGVTTEVFVQNWQKLSLIITKYFLLSRALADCWRLGKQCRSWSDCSRRLLLEQSDLALHCLLRYLCLRAMHLELNWYHIYPAIRQSLPHLELLQVTKSVLRNFAIIQTVPNSPNNPKQSQRSRSVLYDGSRFLGLFWKKIKLVLLEK